MFWWGNFAVGKNFRGEPGKVEKAVLKSLELKILVLNRHVPLIFHNELALFAKVIALENALFERCLEVIQYTNYNYRSLNAL